MKESTDDEKTIALLDSLVWIQYPDEYGKIHKVDSDSEDFRIVPKYQKTIGPDGVCGTKSGYKYAASVKEAFEVLRHSRSSAALSPSSPRSARRNARTVRKERIWENLFIQ